MSSLKKKAEELASYGRNGDSMLLHVAPEELRGLASLMPDGQLTTNPDTGLPEAFFFLPLLVVSSVPPLPPLPRPLHQVLRLLGQARLAQVLPVLAGLLVSLPLAHCRLLHPLVLALGQPVLLLSGLPVRLVLPLLALHPSPILP